MALRVSSYFMIMGAGALIIVASFSLMNALGLTSVQTNYENIQRTQPQWTTMTDPSRTPNPIMDFLSDAWNTVTGFGYGVGKFLLGIAYVKGIIDQYTMGRDPYETIAWYIQGLNWFFYGLGAVGWFLGRNTT